MVAESDMTEQPTQFSKEEGTDRVLSFFSLPRMDCSGSGEADMM